MVFKTSEIVPSAEGGVKVKKDDNNNYSIDLHVKHLTYPKNLTPSKEVYVVWMTSDKYISRNIGQLSPSKGLFSKTIKSSLETVSAIKPSGFFVTAEDDGDTQYPGDMVVLKTK